MILKQTQHINLESNWYSNILKLQFWRFKHPKILKNTTFENSNIPRSRLHAIFQEHAFETKTSQDPQTQIFENSNIPRSRKDTFNAGVRGGGEGESGERGDTQSAPINQNTSIWNQADTQTSWKCKFWKCTHPKILKNTTLDNSNIPRSSNTQNIQNSNIPNILNMSILKIQTSQDPGKSDFSPGYVGWYLGYVCVCVWISYMIS